MTRPQYLSAIDRIIPLAEMYADKETITLRLGLSHYEGKHFKLYEAAYNAAWNEAFHTFMDNVAKKNDLREQSWQAYGS